MLKSEITRRLRLRRIAETYPTMQNAGVTIFRDEKADVFYSGDGDTVPLLDILLPAFYSSREIKEIGMAATTIRGSRAVGVLLAETAPFVVYNTGDSLMKWDYKPELRVKVLLTKLLCRERLTGLYALTEPRGLILGDNMETAYNLMTGGGDVKRSYFVLDGNYEHFHYCLNSREGEVMLRILCDGYFTDELNRILTEDLHPRVPGLAFEHDALDSSNNPVLFAWPFNITRIVRFDSALRIHRRTGTLICFDFQEDVLRRYCSENARFQTISLDKLERRFFS